MSAPNKTGKRVHALSPMQISDKAHVLAYTCQQLQFITTVYSSDKQFTWRHLAPLCCIRYFSLQLDEAVQILAPLQMV